jgi:hypothetical protein
MNEQQLVERWRTAERAYLVLEGPKVAGIEKLLGREWLHLVKESGGKFLYSNHMWTTGIQP